MRPHGTWLPPLWAPRLATPATLSLCGASVSHVSPGASLLGWSLCLPGCVSSARLAPSCLGSQVDALPSCPRVSPLCSLPAQRHHAASSQQICVPCVSLLCPRHSQA